MEVVCAQRQQAPRRGIGAQDCHRPRCVSDPRAMKTAYMNYMRLAARSQDRARTRNAQSRAAAALIAIVAALAATTAASGTQ